MSAKVADGIVTEKADSQGNQGLTPNNSPGAMSKPQTGFWANFVDERNNLKFVNYVVYMPRMILIFFMGMCLVISWLLGKMVFAQGNPITPDTYTYDIEDVRSIAFDSFTLASSDVQGEYEVFRSQIGTYTSGNEEFSDVYLDMKTNGNHSSYYANKENNETLLLSEVGDFTYWIYEAEKDAGVFSPEGLEIMEEAESMFPDHPKWDRYCLREYPDPNNPDDFKCAKALSAMNIFKASSWNQAMVDSIMERLDNPVAGLPTIANPFVEGTFVGGREIYQLIGFCTKFGVACDVFESGPFAAILTETNIEDAKAFAVQLDEDFQTITDLWDGTGVINPNPDDVSLLCAYMKELPSQAFLVDFFFSKEFSKTNLVSKYSRSITRWGAPNDPKPEYKDWEEERKNYVLDNFFDDMDRIAGKEYSSHINAYYFMRVLILDVFIGILANDGMFAAISIAIVYFYMWFMLGSFFLANVGFFEIVMSIPTAWFVADQIIGVKYFSGLNPLCLFIVAAIGADDIFVFIDAYRQSAFKGAHIVKDFETRMSYVYRRAGLAMLITSATTCSAFLCTVASPIASTKSFGIFASLVIFMDYALVMTCFCTAVVLYHDYFEENTVSVCNDVMGAFGCFDCCCPCCCPCIPKLKETSTERAAKRSPDDPVHQDKITEFYKGTFTNFILHPGRRLPTMAVLFVWLFVAMYYMTKLEPTKKAEQFLDDEHPLQKAITILNEGFPVASDDRGAKMYYIWGIKDVDRTGVSQMFDDPGFDDPFVGKPVFDDEWKLTKDCQAKIYNYTVAVRSPLNDDKYFDFVKVGGGGMRAVSNWMDEMKDWIEGGGTGSFDSTMCARNTLGRPSSFPVPDSEMEEALVRFAHQPSCSDSAPYPDAFIIDTYKETSRGSGLSAVEFGFNGEELKMAAVSMESKVLDPWSEISETLAMKQYEFFMEEADYINSIMGDVCGDVMMTDADQKFILMNNQKIFRTSAVTGALIGCAIAFLVILVSTMNPLIAVFATFSITCVLCSVVGAVTMQGWTLGTTTAILISILAGFSVDYVVHLAHAFVETPGCTEQRVRGAFADMGVSVMSGMLTSVLASLPLFLCKINFFSAFGTFLCATIGFSWIYANFMFMGLMATFDVMKFSMKKQKKKGAKIQEGVEMRQVSGSSVDV
ncbi:hypothetical protein TrRE_jg3946 [Triparma retinervis]|uniref:SSD domain-containing protein n=1 Tax=Triparma retinervis TaxID=2557542 RepID=A0A9W6ZIL1_9STRA|nr:hypothetical protein TrRE_jg3946 [Triparma retinervis]